MRSADEGRQRDVAPPRFRLRFSPVPAKLGCGLDDAYGAPSEIDAAAPEAGDLREAKSARGGEVDHRPPLGLHGPGETVELVELQRDHLRALECRELDAACR